MRNSDTNCRAGLRLASACFLALGLGCVQSVELPASRPAAGGSEVVAAAPNGSGPAAPACLREERWLAGANPARDTETRWLLAAHARALCAQLQGRISADWQLDLRLLDGEAPRGWTVERALGIELSLRNRKRTQTSIRPYSALYAPADRVRTTDSRFTRRLYYELRGGYALLDPGVAPDRIYAVTEEFVILAPSAFGADADGDALEAAQIFDAFYGISKARTDRLSVQLETPPASLDAIQAQYPDRRALVVHEPLARRLWLATF